MKPVEITYGERYGDNSGWERRLSIDTHSECVEIDAVGAHVAIGLYDLWWIVRHALAAREALGMDKLILDGPAPQREGSHNGD